MLKYICKLFMCEYQYTSEVNVLYKKDLKYRFEMFFPVQSVISFEDLSSFLYFA